MEVYPPDGPSSFADLVAPLPAAIRDVATLLRGTIRTTVPEADEAVSGGSQLAMVLYSINGVNNVVCGIQPTATTCRLFFHGWAQLKAAGYRLEGSGKSARHIKIGSPREFDREQVEAMLRTARAYVAGR